MRLCRDVAKERLIVTALNAALGWWRSPVSSLALSYWGDGVGDYLIKSDAWYLRRGSARGQTEPFSPRRLSVPEGSV